MIRMRKIKSNPMRQSARDERCTLEIMDVCSGDSETTVLAHLPDDGGIMGGKPDDLSACYACYACHRVIDGVDPWPEEEAPLKDYYMRRAMVRTWRRLHEKGVIDIKGVKFK